MRVAVISDTHMPRGARTLPGACLERLRAADLILHAGDVTASVFLEELRALGPPVEAVFGNMDEPALADRTALLTREDDARAGRPAREARSQPRLAWHLTTRTPVR
jgi:putative phosphoesterase